MATISEAGINIPLIKAVCERYGAKDVALFGSFVRGDAGPDSDVDLLITAPKGMTLLDLIGLEQDLEDALGRSVDVATRRGLSRHIGPQILAEAVTL